MRCTGACAVDKKTIKNKRLNDTSVLDITGFHALKCVNYIRSNWETSQSKFAEVSIINRGEDGHMERKLRTFTGVFNGHSKKFSKSALHIFSHVFAALVQGVCLGGGV